MHWQEQVGTGSIKNPVPACLMRLKVLFLWLWIMSPWFSPFLIFFIIFLLLWVGNNTGSPPVFMTSCFGAGHRKLSGCRTLLQLLFLQPMWECWYRAEKLLPSCNSKSQQNRRFRANQRLFFFYLYFLFVFFQFFFGLFQTFGSLRVEVSGPQMPQPTQPFSNVFPAPFFLTTHSFT